MNLITITIDADREVVTHNIHMMLNAIAARVADRQMIVHDLLIQLHKEIDLLAAPKRQQAAMDERAEFEKCFSTKWPAYGHWNPFGIDSDGSYSSSHVHAAFLGWKNGRSAL